MKVRIGQGFDTHVFSDDPSRVLVLGGVEFEGARGLVGHSDADVVTHAIVDALLGAASLGDIGEHFADTDPRWHNAPSEKFLTHAVDLLRDAGYVVGNVDCTVITEEPKISPNKAAMAANLSRLVNAPVGVKASRAEGLGAIGRHEGAACFAVALIESIEGK